MNQQPVFDIQAAIGQGINFRQNAGRVVFPTRNDMNQLDDDLERRKRDALAMIRERQLKKKSKAELQELQRLKAKQEIFKKYCKTFEKELTVLKIQMKSTNEYDEDYWRLFTISISPYSTEMLSKVIQFEQKLECLRSSPCYFKYCNPTLPCYQRFFCWPLCWFAFPCYCCYKECVYSQKTHDMLQQVYERYEQLIVAENQAVACPHQ